MGAISQLLRFPTPLPLLDKAQDTSSQQDIVNALIVYINTIIYGDNAALLALLKANNLDDLTNIPLARINLGLLSAATHAATDFDLAGAAAAAQAAAIAASDPVGSAAAAQAAAEAASDPAGSAATVAAAKANKGINADITALTALSITAKSTSYVVVNGDQTIEMDASGGARTVTYSPSTVAGRVTVIKIDTSYNPVNISDGTNVLYSLVAPAVGGFYQQATAYTNGAALRVIG